MSITDCPPRCKGGTNIFLYHLKVNHVDKIPEPYLFGSDNAGDPGNEDFAKRQTREAAQKVKQKAKKVLPDAQKKEAAIEEAGDMV